jgi:hypothetical protein
MSQSEFGSIDDFLNYRGSEGGGQKRLKDWKKKGQLTFFFHMMCMPSRVWLHNVPELVVRTDRETNVQKKSVWGRTHVCHEDESILKKQRFKTQDGRREHPPKRCGACRMTEGVRNAILDGQLQDTDVVFKFDGADNPTENRVIHAGGLCDFWKRNDLDEATKARLLQHGIHFANIPGRPGAWAENTMAALNYIFAIVDNEAIGEGLQIAIQQQIIGDEVRRMMNDEIASKDDLGNPFKNPYAIQLIYNAAATLPKDKYRARRMDKFAVTDVVDKIIRSPKPDLSKFTTKFDPAALRSLLEAHAQVDLPWDSYFIPIPTEEKSVPPVEPPPQRKTISVPSGAPAPKPAAAPVEELGDPCDCGAPMTKTQTKCGKCGAVYAITPDPVPAAASAAPAATSAPAASEDYDAADYQDDRIPF